MLLSHILLVSFLYGLRKRDVACGPSVVRSTDLSVFYGLTRNYRQMQARTPTSTDFYAMAPEGALPRVIVPITLTVSARVHTCVVLRSVLTLLVSPKFRSELQIVPTIALTIDRNWLQRTSCFVPTE